jgi:serine/threonine protein kinase/pimeloyl-ACP methyl ester carboxylesterase
MTSNGPETTDPDDETVAGEAVRLVRGRGFDGYELVRPLGRGGMGTVWLGHDGLLDRPVALKFLNTQDDPDPRGSRLLAEARALARVSHPNVAAVYRVGEAQGRPYIAYEYLDGPTLARVARPMPWRQVLELGLGLARGIAAAHRHGVLHRDIKPANIVLTGTGEPKLIDFGIAQIFEGELRSVGEGVSLSDHSRTDASLAGTPLYMAPERWQGQPASESADLYALGLVLYELVVGAPAHGELAGDALLVHLATREVPPVTVADAPAAFCDLLARVTASSPRERYARAEAVVDAFEVVRALYRSFVDREGADDDEHARLVASFQRLRERGAELGQHFYENLFIKHPEVRPLFPADMRGQQHKLEVSIELVIRRLGARDELIPLLEDLGRRHGGYGATAAHFEAVGAQLLESLEALSGDAWDGALRRAWAHAYDRIAHVMVRGLQRAQIQEAATQDLVPPTQWDLPVGPPLTQYARSGRLSIAYQVIGAAPLDLLVIPALVSHLDVGWEHPAMASFLRRLSSFARVIVIDKRGTGLSDRGTDALALDDQVADIDAVLDAVGADRAAVMGFSAGSALAATYAALRPERARALILDGASPTNQHGLSPGLHESVLAQIGASWGGPLLLDDFAPSLASDPALREWWARYLRTGASPGAAEALWRWSAEMDLRALLPAIRAPTLLLHRREDRFAPIAGARAAAGLIPGARLVELAGDAHLPFVGGHDAVVDEVHRFLGGASTQPAAPLDSRLVAAVAFAAEPASWTPLRGLFGRAFAGVRVLAQDPEECWAELPSATAALACAEKAISALGLLGLPSAAAVCAGFTPLGGDSRLREGARASARATPTGKISVDSLARELLRGSSELRDEAGVLRFL